jgi:hypothetical protein
MPGTVRHRRPFNGSWARAPGDAQPLGPGTATRRRSDVFRAEQILSTSTDAGRVRLVLIDA